MAWDSRAPLKAYIKNQRVVDAKLRRTLMSAANDARQRLRGLDPSSLRYAQIQLQQAQLRMWANVGDIIEDGIVTNGRIVAEVNAAFSDDLLKQLGVKSSTLFKQQMMAQSQQTIKTYLAHQQLGMTLSERVYKNGVVSSGRIERLVGNGILRGASAREIATDVAKFINPNTPGGASYAAMRLGRTELNNSFHAAANESYMANPFVDKVKWELSSSHPKPDECDELVKVYTPDNVPDKPHPQCFCYTTPVVISRTQLVQRFKRGEYDEWADSRLVG